MKLPCAKGLEEENEEERNGRIVDNKISSNWEPRKERKTGERRAKKFH